MRATAAVAVKEHGMGHVVVRAGRTGTRAEDELGRMRAGRHACQQQGGCQHGAACTGSGQGRVHGRVHGFLWSVSAGQPPAGLRKISGIARTELVRARAGRSATPNRVRASSIAGRNPGRPPPERTAPGDARASWIRWPIACTARSRSWTAPAPTGVRAPARTSGAGATRPSRKGHACPGSPGRVRPRHRGDRHMAALPGRTILARPH